MSLVPSSTRLTIVFAAFMAFALGAGDVAYAKVGGGSSFGSRGGRTFSAPPATNTAPSAPAPIQKSITQPRPATTATASVPARPSLFGGFRGLLLGGLIGAGLASIFGTGSFASVLGFLLQTALIIGAVMLAVSFFRGRRFGMPSMATALNAGSTTPRQPPNTSYRTGTGMSSTAAALSIGPDDFSSFERLLGEIQLAYGRGDTNALGDRVTPEMLSYFAGDLKANADKGVRNEISAPKLLQGDLSEAWHEVSGEYATVAMRFSLLDRTIDTASGRAVSGSATVPTESTELWTFRRPLNGRPDQWTLSAIQQAN